MVEVSHKVAFLLLAFALVSTPSRGENMEPTSRHSLPMPPPRSGDAAVQEEYEAALRRNTREAYDLFIARHPEHPLSRLAWTRREGLPPR